uniref:Uncharacterized protein n=1 Tax=Desertifilum tharense IPPAS B-1220 TaxID=1781255 RepID=A0ACD5GPR8_9CYAN
MGRWGDGEMGRWGDREMGGWVLTQHLEEGERVLSQVEGSWGGYHPQKDRLRGEIWQRLKQEGVAVGDPVDRIPNFVGAGEAAVRLASLDVWQQAKTVKCNPDSPQIPVRLRALQEGKRLYMAVPRLTDARCFVELTAEGLQEKQIPLEQVAIAHHALSYDSPGEFCPNATDRFSCGWLRGGGA